MLHDCLASLLASGSQQAVFLRRLCVLISPENTLKSHRCGSCLDKYRRRDPLHCGGVRRRCSERRGRNRQSSKSLTALRDLQLCPLFAQFLCRLKTFVSLQCFYKSIYCKVLTLMTPGVGQGAASPAGGFIALKCLVAAERVKTGRRHEH